MWTLLVTVVGTLLRHRPRPPAVPAPTLQAAYQGFDPTNQALTGLALGSLAIGVLGVLVVTGEYGSGTIRSSLAAAPPAPLFLGGQGPGGRRRRPGRGRDSDLRLLLRSARPSSRGDAPTASLGQPGRAAGSALVGAYLALLGSVRPRARRDHPAHGGRHRRLRRDRLPAPASSLQPLSHGNPGRFTPMQILANSVAAVVPQPGQLSPAVGFLLMVLYCAVALAVGTAACSLRRDA